MCTLSWTEFLHSAREVISLSEKFDDNWSLKEKDKGDGNSYLVYRQKLRVILEDLNEDVSFVDSNIEHPQVECVNENHKQNNEQIVEIEYHVVYSISYQVPVLYFRGYRNDGKPIGLDDAWKIFHNPTGGTNSRAHMLETLTQSDHPVLFQPFLSLHPCRTSELLAQMQGSKNIVLTFLSIMGPYIRLNLRNEYGLAFHEQEALLEVLPPHSSTRNNSDSK